MAEIIYEKSNDSWPLRAKDGAATFKFSGTLDSARIALEKARAGTSSLVNTVMLTIGAIGGLAFIYSAYNGYQNDEYLFFLQHSFVNLIFYISLLADMYYWAKRTKEALDHETGHILSIAKAAEWQKEAKEVNIYQFFAKETREVWNATLSVSRAHGASNPNTSHLFLALLGSDVIRMLFIRFGINPDSLKEPLEQFIVSSRESDTSDELLLRIPYIALQESLKLHNKAIDPLMILCALVSELPESHVISKIFFTKDLTKEKIEIISSWIFNLQLMREEDIVFRKLARYKHDNGVNAGLTSVPTPYLDQFSQDLTIAAKYHRLPIALGRETDLEQILRLFSDGGKDLLIEGEPGTGRTTVVNELAFRMASEQVPQFLQDKRLVKLEIAGIVGSKINPEQVLLNIFKEAEGSGNLVLVFEDVHIMAKATGTEGLSLMGVLVNHLENSPIPVIATTTPEDYQKSLRNVANFDQEFATYELKDLSSQAVMLACCTRASFIEGQTGAFFQYQAIEEAVRLSDQYFKDLGQPQKAIEIIKEAGQVVKSLPVGKDKLITPEIIQKIVGEKTHVPQGTFTENEAEKLLNLEAEMGKRVIGQKEAVTAVAEGLRRARSGLSSGMRPLASFLFIGPTGVGKTELAKTLSKVYFGDERYLLRLDMSEYQGSDGMRKLLGSAEGNDSTPFITHLKTYPFCLFLLDELEKASGDVLNLFLQVLEDGRITTGGGQTLDLTHTIIIATSNAGTPEILVGLKDGQTLAQIKEQLFSKILVNYFRPEFMNRFDAMVVFTPLVIEEVRQISKLQLNGLAKQLFEKGIKITFTDAVVNTVAEKGFDPLLGGRPIRRYIQDHVEGIIAKLMLEKKLIKGATVTLDLDEAGNYIAK